MTTGMHILLLLATPHNDFAQTHVKDVFSLFLICLHAEYVCTCGHMWAHVHTYA